MTTYTRTQLQRLQRTLPLQVPPSVLGPPYLAPEQRVGDVVDYVPAATLSVYPIPTALNVVKAGGNVVAHGVSPSYTIQQADLGSVLTLTQSPFNIYGSDSKTSAAVTVLPVRTAGSTGYLGGNLGGPAAYFNNVFVNNCAIRGLGLVNFGAGASTGYSAGTRDADGWPNSAGASWWISTPTNGTPFDGAVPASVDGSGNPLLPGNAQTGPLSVYHCTYTCPVATTSADVVGQSGCTVSNWQSLGGNQYSFDLSVAQRSNVCLGIKTPHSNLDIPFDGATPTSIAGEFLQDNITNAASIPSLRLMDVCNTNLTNETTWGTRVVDGAGYSGMAWERIFRYINTVYSAPGSVAKQFWINLPHGCDDNYVTQVANLARSMLTPGVHLILEWSNEPWNFAFVTFGYALTQALNEAWTVSNYAVVAGDANHQNFITSITQSGGVATVTLTKNINLLFKQDGTTPFITNGALVYVVNKSNSAWNGTNSGTSVGGSAANQVAVAITTGGALASNQFSYPCATTAPATMVTTDGICFFFNTTSTLVADKTSFDANNFSMKFMTRRAKQCAALWKAVRPTDEIAVNLQQWPGTLSQGLLTTGNIASSPPLFFPYGNWLGNGNANDTLGLKTWCDIAAIAPYVFAGCSAAIFTSGSNVIQNVPWAASAVVGDSVFMYGGGGVSSVVAPGSSGTNLVIADTMTAGNSTTGVGQVVYGTAIEVNGYISGTTLTVTSTNSINSSGSYLRVCKGGKVYDPNGLIPAGITMSAYGTATGDGSGIIGTYTLSANAGNVYSAGSPGIIKIGGGDPVAILQSMLQSGVPESTVFMRAHIYECNVYGIKPYAYEGGPDIARQYSLMSEIWSYGQNNTPPNPTITMGTIETALLDAWFGAGGQAFHHFIVGPGQKADLISAFGNAYSINNKFGEMTPAYAAFRAYASKSITVAGKNACPGTALATSNVYNPSGAIQTAGNAAGMCYWANNTADRRIDFDLTVNRSRRISLAVWGSDSITSTVDVYVNDTFIGGVTLAANGAGNSASTTPAVQTSPALLLPLAASGLLRVSLRMPAGRGNNAGIKQIVTTAY